MMETKFTPGPWELDWGTTHSGSIATIHHTSQREGWAEIWSPNYSDEMTQTANAYLIKEAPNMYHALKNIDDRLRVCMRFPITTAEAYDSFYQEIVADVLAKARGEQ